MRRCVLCDDGDVAYYLDANDSTKKENGDPANLDGTDGQIMVEIPAHYRKFEIEGTKCRCLLSERKLSGFHFVPLTYRSAYEATLDRTVTSTPKLASVENTSEAFRGGVNSSGMSAWDGTYRSVLGKPVTSVSFANFRKYARNRGIAGKNGAGWNCDLYEVQKTCFWLYAVEYANFNCQLGYNAKPTSEGYKQGGLGEGVTTLSDADWNTYNSVNPFVPCGHTNILGNRTGVVDYEMPASDGSVFNTVSVPSYRGLENPFGHIWSFTDGCKCNTQGNIEGGVSEFYVCSDPAKFQSNDYTDYEKIGDLPREAGYIKTLMIGEHGENMPSAVGGGSSTYFCDYFFTYLRATTEQKAIILGGRADYGERCGLLYSDINISISSGNTSVGSRLCFLPE
ncbi:MAG: hypothetical protein K2L01_06920 [Rikenellaceae bacterium]|nr:hypothetical protein [Rikenellaceae bacterium]